ncbi:hypothetical protein SAMN05443244_2451 [Terriglobus roseus]|uniref:Uncharacterized protein n=2 Tax=Terriglobus roseus TaxID=392734 RepID=A0A1H4P4V1_9BACT|nr:hypothetical protein SAMN05443244_2451 [Terriglobus roseus]
MGPRWSAAPWRSLPGDILHIMPRRNIPHEHQDALATQQRQQVGAALWLGAGVIAVIVYRAAIHGMFLQGWWRIW